MNYDMPCTDIIKNQYALSLEM